MNTEENAPHKQVSRQIDVQLRQQCNELAAAHKRVQRLREALEETDEELRFAEDTVKGREGEAITKARGLLQQALAETKNKGEQP